MIGLIKMFPYKFIISYCSCISLVPEEPHVTPHICLCHFSEYLKLQYIFYRTLMEVFLCDNQQLIKLRFIYLLISNWHGTHQLLFTRMEMHTQPTVKLFRQWFISVKECVWILKCTALFVTNRKMLFL